MAAIGQREQGPPGDGAVRVVVVGAGFGGLAAVRRLAGAGTRTTLIDSNIYATFQPLLYEVATAGLTSSDVAFPARSVSYRHHAAFRHGDVADIDPAARQITLADGAVFGYDYLILATGVAAAYHGVPGAAEYSLGLYTRRDAIVLRDRIMTGLERLSLTGLSSDVAVTVIGGGATGVELAGSIADLRNIALPVSYPEIDRARVHVSLIERDPALLAPFHPALRDYTRQQLVKRGVDVRLGTAIAEITPSQVLLADGTALASDVTVWAAGVAAPEAVRGWGLPQAAGGRIVIGPDLRVIGQDRIFAVGDIALIEDQPLPQLAQPALQMGKHAADQIRRLTSGQSTAPFRYHDKGIMATIGYRSAVVQLPRHVRIHGTLAWLAWLALHLVTLLGGRNRISALVNMSWRYLTWRRGGGLIVGEGMTGLVPVTGSGDVMETAPRPARRP
jgi:NADH:ubiquinone reductase (H+-translocating)